MSRVANKIGCVTGCVPYIFLEGARYTGSILWLHIVGVGAGVVQSTERIFSMKLKYLSGQRRYLRCITSKMVNQINKWRFSQGLNMT